MIILSLIPSYENEVLGAGDPCLNHLSIESSFLKVKPAPGRKRAEFR